MDNTKDILDDYLQMRQSNAAREMADMSMLKRLSEELQKAREIIAQQNKLIQQLHQTIEDMKSAQPVNNTYEIGRDFVANQTINT